MKILIIYPYCLEDRIREDDVSVPPMGVYFVGAMLKENGYVVEILNFWNIRSPGKIREVFEEKKPDIVGFSILHANRWGGIEMAGIAKQADPKVKIVFGGIGATFLWEHLLSGFEEIDAVVIGEGERTFLRLAEYYKAGRGKPGDIPGIAFRKGGELVNTGPVEAIADLDALPNPARYFEYQHVTLSRGCPENCVFCGSPSFWGRRLRFHSPDYFVDQLQLLYNKGVSFFYFSDDNFCIQKDRAVEVCDKIIERGLDITWAAISRVSHVDERVLSRMKKAGCVQISYGVESGSKRIRDRLNKKITDEQIEKAFSMTTKYGILPRAYIIYGSPGETRETIKRSVKLMDRIRPLSAVFYILDVFPGTALYSDLKKRTNITDDVWMQRIEDIMYFETDPKLTRDMILEFGETLRSNFYRKLPEFAEQAELVDDPDFYRTNSDFISKLAMTFTHGDYSGIGAIADKEKTATVLYEKSLGFYPDHRAFLGLGILKQKNGEYEESVRVLSQGLEHYPESEPLNMCIGISHMNLGEYEKALPHFLKFKTSKEAAHHIENCCKALGK